MRGQVQTILVPGCLSKLADIWRRGVDRCRQFWFLGVSLGWRTFGGHLVDTCFTFGHYSIRIRIHSFYIRTIFEEHLGSKSSEIKNKLRTIPASELMAQSKNQEHRSSQFILHFKYKIEIMEAQMGEILRPPSLGQNLMVLIECTLQFFFIKKEFIRNTQASQKIQPKNEIRETTCKPFLNF